MPEKIDFTGTFGNTVAETTTRTFKGSATYEPRPSRVIYNFIKIAIPVTITIALFKFVLEPNTSFYLPTIPQIYTPPQQTIPPEPVALSEPLSAKLREFGIDSYIVVVSAFDNAAQATELEYLLRQRRTHAKHLAFNSRYYVFVGPLYGKPRMDSALKSLYRWGYNEAYAVYPE